VSRQKKRRFADNLLRENVIEPGKDWYTTIKGQWSAFFQNENPLVLELACGRGEYTIGLARHFSEKNHIGVDIKGDRIWAGSGMAIREGLRNAAFIRSNVYFMKEFFNPNEISEIWLTFPDPRPKDKDEKRRLTHISFMQIYRVLLHPDGWFKFKTDNTGLFNYTLENIQNGTIKVKNLHFTHDLYHSDLHQEHLGIKTRYEQLFFDKGESIKYMKFQFEQL